MRKIGISFLIFWGTLFWGCYEGEYECFSNLRVNYITASDVDSVHFYLNSEQVCLQKAAFKELECENCSKGMLLYSIDCKTSADNKNSINIDSEDGVQQCILSDDFPKWNVFECIVDEKDKRDIDSSKLVLVVYSEKMKKVIQPNIFFRTGKHYNIVSDQDTAKWYSYSRATRQYYYDYYGSSESWKRDECCEGMCVASLPMTEGKVCYDK